MHIGSKAGRNTERSVGFGKERASLDNKARGSLSPQVLLNLTHLRKLGWQFVRRKWSSLFLRKEALQSPDDFIPVFSTFHLKPVCYYSALRWAHKTSRTITPLFLDHDWKWTHIPLYIYKQVHTLQEFSSHSFSSRFISPILLASLRTCVPSLKFCGLKAFFEFLLIFFYRHGSDSLHFNYYYGYFI